MEFAWYSISMIFAYAITRWFTENFKIHIRSERLWLHHWILASILMLGFLAAKIESEIIWGVLTGIALEGLGRKNWSISRK